MGAGLKNRRCAHGKTVSGDRADINDVSTWKTHSDAAMTRCIGSGRWAAARSICVQQKQRQPESGYQRTFDGTDAADDIYYDDYAYRWREKTATPVYDHVDNTVDEGDGAVRDNITEEAHGGTQTDGHASGSGRRGFSAGRILGVMWMAGRTGRRRLDPARPRAFCWMESASRGTGRQLVLPLT
ncbi:MAG: hypothetical protein ACLR23_14655 [Clostridia bacterium]